MLAGRVTLASGGAFQGGEQFHPEQRKVALNPAFTSNQHMIIRGNPVLRQQITQQFPEPALHPVADNRIADSLGNCDAKAHLLRFIGPSEQHKPGTRDAQSPVGS